MHNGNCVNPNLVNVYANIRNTSSSCYIYGTQGALFAYINGTMYTTECVVMPNGSNSCGFIGPSLLPGRGYTIQIVTNKGACTLDPNGNPDEIHELGWLGGQEHGPSNYNGYYWDCSCREPVDGKCKETNMYLCEQGNPINQHYYTGQFIWTWNCSGLNGGNPSNQCTFKMKYDGVCNTNAKYTCNGPMSATSTGYNSSTNTYTWTCPGINGGSSASCTFKDTSPVSPKCGSADYTCEEGGVVNRDNPFNRYGGYQSSIWAGKYWECAGGGSSVSCGTYWLCPEYVCHQKISGWVPECGQVYGGNSVIYSWVNRDSNAAYNPNIDGLEKYCGTKHNKVSCNSVGLAQRTYQGTSQIKAVTLPYTATYEQTAQCCEFSSATGEDPVAECFVNGKSSTNCPTSNKPACT